MRCWMLIYYRRIFVFSFTSSMPLCTFVMCMGSFINDVISFKKYRSCQGKLVQKQFPFIHFSMGNSTSVPDFELNIAVIGDKGDYPVECQGDFYNSGNLWLGWEIHRFFRFLRRNPEKIHPLFFSRQKFSSKNFWLQPIDNFSIEIAFSGLELKHKIRTKNYKKNLWKVKVK